MSSIVNKSDIENGLITLGVKAGMSVEVHCSLSSFGYVVGGAETVIETLMNIIGKDGAIIMPSFRLSPNIPLSDFDKELDLTLKIKILHNDEEKSAMGIVSDTFRNMPDVATGQGLFRVSAWGKDIDKHSLGFQHLIDTDGFALLFGVDIYRLSSMHYMEDALPNEIKNRFKPTEKARKIYPEDQWFIEAWQPPIKSWHKIQSMAYDKGYIKDCMIGDAKCMFLQVKKVLDLYRQALLTDPFALYGISKE